MWTICHLFVCTLSIMWCVLWCRTSSPFPLIYLANKVLMSIFKYFICTMLFFNVWLCLNQYKTYVSAKTETLEPKRANKICLIAALLLLQLASLSTLFKTTITWISLKKTCAEWVIFIHVSGKYLPHRCIPWFVKMTDLMIEPYPNGVSKDLDSKSAKFWRAIAKAHNFVLKTRP